MQFHSIDATAHEGVALADLIEDREDRGIELRDEVDAAIRTLPKIDREILKAYFLDGLTMRQIGINMGRAESRISQRVSVALTRLRPRTGDSTMADKNGFNLQEMKSKTPPVDPAEAIRKAAALGLSGAMKEDDVAAVYRKLKEMALAGDRKAMDMFFKLTLGSGNGAAPAAPPSADGGKGMQAMANALRDLVDEIRITKAEQAALANGGPPPKNSAARIKHMRDDDDED